MIEHWGDAPDGSPVQRVTISGGQLSASVLSFGACLQDLRFEGSGFPLVLGYDHFEPYLRNPVYFGASVGRFANRISQGHTTIDGAPVQLEQNVRPHHIHGGSDGSSFRNWTLMDYGDAYAVFEDTLPDGHMGYPGDLTVTARYEIDCSALTLTYQATSNAPTLCNFTGHSYFHLDDGPDLRNHTLQVVASLFTERSRDGIPTGTVSPTIDTFLDFADPRPLVFDGSLLKIDDNFCLGAKQDTPKAAAVLKSKASGLSLALSTTEPGLQVYTMAQPSTPSRNLTGVAKSHTGIALEPQIWPDAPNHANFPSAILRPNEMYCHISRYQVSRIPD